MYSDFFEDSSFTNTVGQGPPGSARQQATYTGSNNPAGSTVNNTSLRRASSRPQDKNNASIELISNMDSGVFSPAQPSKFRSGFFSQNATKKQVPTVILKTPSQRKVIKLGTAVPRTVNLYGGSELGSFNLSRKGSSKGFDNDAHILDSVGSTAEKDSETMMIGPFLKRAIKIPFKVLTTDRSLLPESERSSRQTEAVQMQEEIVPLFSGRNSLYVPESSSRSYKWRGSLGNVTNQSGRQSGSSGVVAVKMGSSTLKQLARVGADVGMTLKDSAEHQVPHSEESARESSKKRSQPKVEKNLPLRLDTGMDMVKELGQVKVFNQYVSDRENQAKIRFLSAQNKLRPAALQNKSAALNCGHSPTHSHISEAPADEEQGHSRSEMTPLISPKPWAGSAAMELKKLIFQGSVSTALKTKKRTLSWTKDTLESIEPSHLDIRQSLTFHNSFLKSNNASKISRNGQSEINISKEP